MIDNPYFFDGIKLIAKSLKDSLDGEYHGKWLDVDFKLRLNMDGGFDMCDFSVNETQSKEEKFSIFIYKLERFIKENQPVE